MNTVEQQTMNVQIDPEFRSLLLPLTEDESSGLEASLSAEGCCDALVAWGGTQPPTLLDGHNRHAFCEARGLPYQVRLIDLPDRDAARNWIITNQLSRRNVTPEQASYLRGQRYNREKQPQGGTGANQHTQTDHCDLSATAARLADEFKVGEAIIKRDGEFAQAVETLAQVGGEEVREAVLSRDARLPRKDVKTLADLSQREPERAKKILDKIAAGQVSDARDEILKVRVETEAARTLFPDRVEPFARYPHSDRMADWLNAVESFALRVNLEPGGFDALLAEPGKWDRERTLSFILPSLEELRELITDYERRIRDAFEQE